LPLKRFIFLKEFGRAYFKNQRLHRSTEGRRAVAASKRLFFCSYSHFVPHSGSAQVQASADLLDEEKVTFASGKNQKLPRASRILARKIVKAAKNQSPYEICGLGQTILWQILIMPLQNCPMLLKHAELFAKALHRSQETRALDLPIISKGFWLVMLNQPRNVVSVVGQRKRKLSLLRASDKLKGFFTTAPGPKHDQTRLHNLDVIGA
jgi:hypothetical protein